MRTATLERPRIQSPATSTIPATRLKTHLVGRWLPDSDNLGAMVLVWSTVTEPI